MLVKIIDVPTTCPPGHMLGTSCEHVLITFGMFLVGTFQTHGRVSFQL
jgi:hypothetical protein